ncbi:MAG: hypothetical protein BWY79_01830 [Actinobacteria bacterium ADurb.Bin444]|nr:MAG: hypothetical protein BWY79_01830 [Actinobacteria bacterium ADurb.Bin444]
MATSISMGRTTAIGGPPDGLGITSTCGFRSGMEVPITLTGRKGTRWIWAFSMAMRVPLSTSSTWKRRPAHFWKNGNTGARASAPQ